VVRLRVEADGGSRGNPGPAGYGAVVRDADTGEVLRELAGAIGRATNNVAEYRGLIAGLAGAREIDPHAEVEARLDSKLVVEQMAGRWRVKHVDMRALAAEAAGLVRGFASVRFVHVPREQNSHADRLANEAMDAAARGETWRVGDQASPGAEPTLPQPPNRLSGWMAASAPPTAVLLLRHGATAHSGQMRFSGIGDIPLSPLGEEQIRRAASRLAGESVQAIVSSPLPRARASADLVSGLTGLTVSLDDDARETDFGDWEGRTFTEVREHWPADLERWLADPEVSPPGGESFAETARRVARVRERLVAAYPGGRVLLVSHVTPIKTLVQQALEAPPRALFRLHLDVASLTVLDLHADGPAVLRLFNDTGHLAGC